jgi:outer membrane immunogenic protein
MLRTISTVVMCLLVWTCVAAAQDSRSDVAVGGTGWFTKDTNGNGVSQSTTNSGGFLASYRYQFGGFSAVGFDYGFTRNSQVFNTSSFLFAQQQASVHEFTGEYIFKMHHRWKVDPFLMAGGGALFFSPITASTQSIPLASERTQGTFLYGLGADYKLMGPVGVRVQYRGLIYKAPDFASTTFSTGSWTHTAEPMVGLTLRF